MKDHVLVLLPGLLGTELYYHGPDENKETVVQPVWTEDLSALWRTLVRAPERLRMPTALCPGRVLRSVRVFPGFGVEDVYGPLIEFLTTEMDYEEGTNLILFGYDWRQSNIRTADLFALFLRDQIKQGSAPFKLIAHSMGGIIARLCLTSPGNQDLASLIKSFVQIGTPVTGAPRAYLTLKKAPRFADRPLPSHRCRSAVEVRDWQ